MERNRTDLEASWLHNRRLNHAARIIQRRYRLWRSRNHVARFGRDAEVRMPRCQRCLAKASAAVRRNAVPAALASSAVDVDVAAAANAATALFLVRLS